MASLSPRLQGPTVSLEAAASGAAPQPGQGPFILTPPVLTDFAAKLFPLAGVWNLLPKHYSTGGFGPRDNFRA